MFRSPRLCSVAKPGRPAEPWSSGAEQFSGSCRDEGWVCRAAGPCGVVGGEGPVVRPDTVNSAGSCRAPLRVWLCQLLHCTVLHCAGPGGGTRSGTAPRPWEIVGAVRARNGRTVGTGGLFRPHGVPLVASFSG